MAHSDVDIKNIVAGILGAKKSKGGVKDPYFVGCGGLLGALYPAKTSMEKECTSMKSAWVNSNELIHNTPGDFGENSIIYLVYHRGNTPEAIEITELGKEKGVAATVPTWPKESETIEFGDYIIRYAFDTSPDHLRDDIDYAEEKTVCALLMTVELIAQTEGYEDYNKFQEGLGMTSNTIKNVRAYIAKGVLEPVEAHKDNPVICTMGNGAAYGAAYIESIRIFMGIQRLDSSSIRTGEYLHGPSEITGADRPFMLQALEDSIRPLDERALKFLRTYAKGIEVLDTKELGLSIADASVVDYFSHSLFNNVYPIYNHALAEKREHPSVARRYAWKVKYQATARVR